jgi:hypothetical protein
LIRLKTKDSNIPSLARAQRRLFGGAIRCAIVAALVTAGWSSASPLAGASSDVPSAAAGPAWLCQPGQSPDPCASSEAVTAVTANGALTPAAWPTSTAASKFDCFYVDPTSSLAKTTNSTFAVTRLEIYVAEDQASPLSRVCDVWAPLYRSQTLTTVERGLAGDEALMRSTFKVAYDSILPAWQWFLDHSDSKPIVLVGDSQGAAILIHLISTQIDHEPSALRRLLVAVLVGGNLQVPAGKTVGATFTKVPLCASGTETGCAIAFSGYSAQPPIGSVFGRPGQGVSLQSGQTAKAGQQVACVNPAALGGGTGGLRPYLLTDSQLSLPEQVSTPWVTYPGLYSARCERRGGATWLQVTSLAGTSQTRPVVNEHKVGKTVDTGPAWGFHAYEYGLALGNLLQDVASEEAAWEQHH